ncbi:MAG: S8 family serine peptidase [Planctomycetota bacterium]
MAQRRKKSVKQRRAARSRNVERLEAREVMSADPLLGSALGISHHAIDDAPALMQHDAPWLGGSGGFIEAAPGEDISLTHEAMFDTDLAERVEQTLYEAHSQTGHDEVMTKYGFTGAGQTVAVIDSGIAYSHYALGGGLGSNYRVVGGYDFTENDSDPYDDGPHGGHGTHVAGIIGADNPGGEDTGVATGVDLVGLRVFGDDGKGHFGWVEDSLDWVLANQFTYDSPITAINLSLGAEWNNTSNPSWAMLEDEFAAIEAAGIFISVSAGNSFTNYNTPGLGYPASSDHVIPVMSTDPNGNLSYFSQRSTEAIAAPGRWITSTAPDYLGNDGDTIDDDWVSMSGTSMAAPYVAGASVLVREAMEFVGQTGIDQWDIYDHMMSTADTFFDSATSTSYKRLNLEAAIDALMPTDDFGSSVATAHSLGTLGEASVSTQSTLSGVISTLTDADYFTFTAGTTGKVTFTADTVSHDLAADWQGWGGSWTTTPEGAYEIDVVAGQQYTVAMSSSDGLGYYTLSVGIESTFEFTDWGALAAQQTQSGAAATGDTWFRVEANRTGVLTAEVLGGASSIAIYDANQTLVTEIAQVGGDQRFDANVVAGEQYFVRLTGAAESVDVRLTNAISFSGGDLLVAGTAAADAFAYTAGANSHTIAVNGVGFDYTPQGGTVTFAGDGTDTLSATTSAGDDTAILRAGSATVWNDSYRVESSGLASASLQSGGGDDRVTFFDTAGVDNFSGWSDRAEMSGAGYTNDASGFRFVVAKSEQGGDDVATFWDTAGDDKFLGWQDRALMVGGGYSNDARGFRFNVAHATAGGVDTVQYWDSAGDDKLLAWSDRALMVGDGYSNDARGFDSTYVEATTGVDEAIFYDSAGDDRFLAWSDRAYMFGDGYANDARGFDTATAHAGNGGEDWATFYDTPGEDKYVGWDGRARMFGDDYANEAHNFRFTVAYSSGGDDTATFFDGAGDDKFLGWDGRALMVGDGYSNDARGFRFAVANADGGGHDQALFWDSAGDDKFLGWADRGLMVGAGYSNDARGFDTNTAYASVGVDQAIFFDSAGDDRYLAWSHRAYLTGEGFFNDAFGFDSTVAHSINGGNDRATMYDTHGDDVYTSWIGRTRLAGAGYSNEAYGFRQNWAFASIGNDTATFHDGAGDDKFLAWTGRGLMVGDGFSNDARGFDSTTAHATGGGTNTALFWESAGDDDLEAVAGKVSVDYGSDRAEANGFESATAYGDNGGTDTRSVAGALDYAFAEQGAWV